MNSNPQTQLLSRSRHLTSPSLYVTPTVVNLTIAVVVAVTAAVAVECVVVGKNEVKWDRVMSLPLYSIPAKILPASSV